MEDLIFFAAQTLNDAGGDYETFREQIRDEIDQIRAGGMGAALDSLGECWETELFDLIINLESKSKMIKINWEEISEEKFFGIFDENSDAIKKAGSPVKFEFYIDGLLYFGKVTFEDDDCWYLIDNNLFCSIEDFCEQLSI